MPSDATLAEIEARYQRDHQVDGVTFVRWRHPDGTLAYDTGADNALFTGFHLAAASFRYSCEPTIANLEAVHSALRGVELLTTVTGTPGVLVRLAFPLAEAWERIGYDPVKSLTHAGNTWGERMREGWIFEGEADAKREIFLADSIYPVTETRAVGYMFATRTTRDQLVGVVFGLVAAWTAIGMADRPYTLEDDCYELLRRVTSALTTRLESTRGSLRDHTGQTHGTRAHRVRRPLRHALRLLDHRVNGTPLRGSLKWLYRWPFAFTWYYRWTRSTFAWNLRMTTGLTLWMLGERGAEKWMRRCWQFMEHDNPWFQAAANVFGIKADAQDVLDADDAIEKLVARPYGGFFAFQRSSDDWTGAPDRIGPGIDVLLPAWLERWSEKGEA